MPRSTATPESAACIIATSGVKPPEGPTSRTTFAVPAKGFVCRNHARRDYSGPVRSPYARFPYFVNRVEPSGSRRQHSKVVVERHGLDIGEGQHAERKHQGLGNAIIAPLPRPTNAGGRVRCRERLGGMLRYYYRDAA